jgi:hypothetical protein
VCVCARVRAFVRACMCVCMYTILYNIIVYKLTYLFIKFVEVYTLEYTELMIRL